MQFIKLKFDNIFKNLIIKKLERKIEKLYIDKFFDIYTRTGFEEKIKELKKPLKIYLLDFYNISKMNKEKGYKEVNKIFKSFFSEIKNDYLCGRCFSGDEILIATSDIESKHGIKLRKISKKHGLDFRYVKTIHKNDTINKVIEKLINELQNIYD